MIVAIDSAGSPKTGAISSAWSDDASESLAVWAMVLWPRVVAGSFNDERRREEPFRNSRIDVSSSCRDGSGRLRLGFLHSQQLTWRQLAQRRGKREFMCLCFYIIPFHLDVRGDLKLGS